MTAALKTASGEAMTSASSGSPTAATASRAFNTAQASVWTYSAPFSGTRPKRRRRWLYSSSAWSTSSDPKSGQRVGLK